MQRGKTPGALPQPLTGVCCDGSPERLVDPCLELNLFHDSANLPRLALRLRLRLSALSSRSSQPRSISAASLHFFPMLSSPRSAGQHPGAERSRSLLKPPGRTPRLHVAHCWRRLFASAGSGHSPAALRYRRRCHQAALEPAIGQTGGWGCERHLRPRQLPFAPPKLLSTRGRRLPWGEAGARPTPGAIDAPLGSYLRSPRPAQSPRPGDQPHPTTSCRCKPGLPTLGGWRLQLAWRKTGNV